MKKLFLLTILLHLTFIVKAQSFLSLDSCRALALANNKDLLISNEKINAAHYQRKAAFTNYLPNFSATGAYMRNQKEFSLLNNDQKAALSGLGSNLAGPSRNYSNLSRTGSTHILIKRKFTGSPRPGRQFFGGRASYRHQKCICRSHHINSAFIYGR